MDQCSSVPFPLSALVLDVEDKSGLLHYVYNVYRYDHTVGSHDGGPLLQW